MGYRIPQINLSTDFLIVNGWQGVTTVLGPGRRFALWLQGCLKDCDGCIHPMGRGFEPGRELSLNEIMALIQRQNRLDGVTISGGEPFLQAAGLSELLKMIKQKLDIGVILYTGYYLKELLHNGNEQIKKCLSNIDLLIDGPYIAHLDDGIPARGSSNQNLIPLTDRYIDYSRDFVNGNRETVIMPGLNSVSCVGIPGNETKSLLYKL